MISLPITSNVDIQNEIDKSYRSTTYEFNSNTPIYNIDLQIPYYKGNISIPAGTSFHISSEKGCIIDGNNINRCITSYGAAYLSLDNITLINGVATDVSETTITNNNIYLSEDTFGQSTTLNGGGCSILGNTIVTVSNVNLKGCYADGCGGGLYFDPGYNVDSLKYYMFPTPSFIIYKKIPYYPEKSSTYYDFNYTNKNNSNEIRLKSDRKWYYNDDFLNLPVDKYQCIPECNNNMYVHGFINDDNEQESILSIIINKRGYQFYVENDTCNINNKILISNNKAGKDGGGIYINNVSYYINGSDMVIHDNNSNGHGGGLCIENTIGSMFNDNIDNGIFLNKNNVNMIINNISFQNNTATVYGGGMYYYDNYNGLIENCVFKGNVTYGAGGGIFIAGNQIVDFKNDYFSYNSFHYTSSINFNSGNTYNSSMKGYHNANNDRNITTVDDGWGEYKESFDKGTNYYNDSTLSVFGNVIDNIPNYYNWKFKGDTDNFISVIPDTKWILKIKLNNVICNNNTVTKSSKFDNRYIREDDLYNTSLEKLSSLYDVPFLTGGGICIFSAHEVSLLNTIINNNTSDLYGGGLAIFNDISSISSLALDVSNNTSLENKGNNMLFIGDHSFYINSNTSPGLTLQEISTDTNIFYSDIIYISSGEELKGFYVNYYSGFSNIESPIKPLIKNKFNNYISVYRDYYEIDKGDEFHIKGSGTNNLLISQSTIKKLDSKSIIHNKGSSRFINISNFNNFICSSLYISNEDVTGDNINTLPSIENVSGGGIITKDISNIILDNLYFDSCSATYGGAFANFTKSIHNTCKIINTTFNNCKSANLGGAIFNFIYNDTDNTGFNNYQYNEEKSSILNITNSTFTNCSSKNRGGAIYSYYNTTPTIDSTIFTNNSSFYGNDIYISDQSKLTNNNTNNTNVFIEGSSCSISTGDFIKGLVYIDDFNTNIFIYNNNNYQKGVDKFYSKIDSSNIDNIKSELITTTDILYQLYDYDYVSKGALQSDTTIINNYPDTNLYLNSREVFRYNTVQNIFNIDSTVIKGFEQKYMNVEFKNKDYKILFSDIKGLFLERINIKAMDNSFINITDIANIEISEFIGNNCNTTSNGGVINIKGNNLNINLKSNIEFISNKANNGGVIYASIKGNSIINIGEQLSDNPVIIANNSAINGGAFYFDGLSTGNISNTASNLYDNKFIMYNHATFGGGIYLNNINTSIANININNNFANAGGGIYIAGKSELTIENTNIYNNSFNTKSVGNFYSKNQAIGGGIYISPNSILNINDNVSIKGNLMYWGGGIFNDVNPDNPLRVNINGANYSMGNNENYDVYVVGNIERVTATSQYNAIQNFNNAIESIDVSLEFSNNTVGRFFTYPIKGDTSITSHNERLNYLFNTYINNELVLYKNDTSEYSTKSSVKSMDINIYSDTFEYNSDIIYNSNGGALEYININGELKDFGKTLFKYSGNSSDHFNNFSEFQFNFNNLLKGININNLHFDSFYQTDSSLLKIQNCNSFTYDNNLNESIYGLDTTNFKLYDVKEINIKSTFNDCTHVSMKSLQTRIKGGFIYVDDTNNIDSNLYFNPVLTNVGAHCYNDSYVLDGDYTGYKPPIGGVVYAYNANIYIENNTFDGKGSIAYDGGFIYKDLDDSKIIDIKGVTISNFNCLNNGGCINLTMDTDVSNTFSLIDVDNISILNCNSLKGYGGGIYMNTAKANLNNISINNCTSQIGGGAIALISNNDNDNNMTINKSSLHFKGNVSHSGSQIYVVGSSLTINDITMDGTEYITNLINNSDNFKGNNGGAIYTESSNLLINNCTFNNFSVYNNGGVIYYDSNYKSSVDYILTIKGSTFNNKGVSNLITNRGGAIYITNNGFSDKAEQLVIKDTEIHDYQSNIGGALFIDNKADRNFMLEISSSNIYNNTIKANFMDNIDTSTYDFYDDVNKLVGFGGGIFMNNIKSITFDTVNIHDNVSIMNYPSDDYFINTYNNDNAYSDYVSTYDDTVNAVNIPDQNKLDNWSDYFIPCGAGIFMINSAAIEDISSTNTTIHDNTPDDVFPSFIKYIENPEESSIVKSDIYNPLLKLNNDIDYINSNTYMWSIIGGGHGGNTTYVDIKSDTHNYGKGGIGSLIELTQQLDMSTINQINYILGDKKDGSNTNSPMGDGGAGGIIGYKTYDIEKNIINNHSSNSLFFKL
jgi:hypothetical protein